MVGGASATEDRQRYRHRSQDGRSRYIAWAKQVELTSDDEVSDGLVRDVMQCVQARPEPGRSEAWKEVACHHEEIKAWLEAARPLRLTKVHELLRREGVCASYWTLRRYAASELDWRKSKPTIRLDDPPAGEQAQADFGDMGYMIDPETGRRRMLRVLIVTLSCSRYAFVWPTFRQTTEAVCEALDAAWRFFGGIPRVIVPDNMKAIIDKADALAPRLTEAFSEYAQARGFFVDPARVRAPKDKARVENTVRYVRDNWFAGESFDDLAEARGSATHWCREVAGTRVHGTTRRVPRDVYVVAARSFRFLTVCVEAVPLSVLHPALIDLLEFVIRDDAIVPQGEQGRPNRDTRDVGP